MKKILFLIVPFLICFAATAQTYNPSLQTVSNKPYGINAAAPTDARSYFYDVTNFTYRPYQSTAEVISYLNLTRYRTGQFDIVVNTGGTLLNGVITGGTNTIWYFKDSTTNGGLVLKVSSITDTTALMRKANNLSDVANVVTARTNLGLGAMATLGAVAGGDLSGTWPTITVAQFNGQLPAYYLNYNNLTNKPVIPAQLNPTGSGLVSITGTYPNLTWTGATPTFEQALLKNNTTSLADSIKISTYPFLFYGTSALGLPVGNTAQRPASPALASLRWNTDIGVLEIWNGTIWANTTPTGSGITSLFGDGTANGPGAASLTLATVNTNAYATNTFLKFAVNGKGLVTSATPVIASDINAALGYTPMAVGSSAGGHLSGTYPNPSLAIISLPVIKIYPGSSPGLNTDSVLVKRGDSTVHAIAVAALVNGLAIGGDLSGTLPNPVVKGLQTLPITNTIPTANQVLKFDGTNWKPGNDSGIVWQAVPALNGQSYAENIQYAQPYAFTNISNNPFARWHDGVIGAEVMDTLISAGGWNNDFAPTITDSVWQSADKGITWTFRGKLPYPIHTPAALKKSDGYYIIGGDYLSTATQRATVYKTTDFRTYTTLTTTSPFRNRILHAGTVFNDTLYVGGGMDTSQIIANGVFTDLWKSADGITWAQVSNSLAFMGKNVSGTMQTFNGRMWQVSGGKYDLTLSNKTFDRSVYSSIDGINWKKMQDSIPLLGKQYPNTIVWDGKLWLLQGFNGVINSNTDSICYMDRSYVWHVFKAPTTNYVGSSNHAAGIVVYRDQIYRIQGNTTNNVYTISRTNYLYSDSTIGYNKIYADTLLNNSNGWGFVHNSSTAVNDLQFINTNKTFQNKFRFQGGDLNIYSNGTLALFNQTGTTQMYNFPTTRIVDFSTVVASGQPYGTTPYSPTYFTNQLQAISTYPSLVLQNTTNRTIIGLEGSQLKIRQEDNGALTGMRFKFDAVTGAAVFTNDLTNNVDVPFRPGIAFQVKSTIGSFLPPSMIGRKVDSINLPSTPAAGSLVYATDGSGTITNSRGWWGYDSTAGWIKINGGSGITNIGSTQNATSYSITSSTGTGTTLNTATTSLAGLLDTARAKLVDSVKNGTWNTAHPVTLKIQGTYLLQVPTKDTLYFDSTKVLSRTNPANGVPVATGLSKFYVHDNDSSLRQTNTLTWDAANLTLNIGSGTAGGGKPKLVVGGGNTLNGSSATQSYFNAGTYNDPTTAASGTAANYNINLFATPTFTATNTNVTFPYTATVSVQPPVAGTNAVLKRRISVDMNNGELYQVGKLMSGAFTNLGSTAGTGAGTTPTLSVSGTDVAGKITLTTGTTPAASATITTITFSSAYDVAPRVILTPANAAAAALSGTGQVFVNDASGTASLFVLTSGSAALAASTQYIWYFMVIQ
jgi:hypothetical protein